MNDRIIVPLDLTDLNEIKDCVGRLKGLITFYKIGAIPFTYFGTQIVQWLKDEGYRVMLDLKYHDIPNTVARACEGAAELGVDFVTIHTSGGFTMLEEAVKAALMISEVKNISGPKLLGITILTSLDEAYFKDLFGDFKRTLEQQVVFLAQLAQSAGLDGVVASPKEIRAIRQACGKELLVVTPGVRPETEDGLEDDQVRTMTPGKAIQAGADYLVIGRPIIRAADPRAAVELIVKEMSNAFGDNP